MIGPGSSNLPIPILISTYEITPHAIQSAIEDLAEVRAHVEEIVKVMKVQAAWRAGRVRLGLAAEGNLTKSQKEKNLPQLIRLLKTSFTPEEIRNFISQ